MASPVHKPFNVPMALTWARIAFIPLIVGIFYFPDAMMSAHTKNLLACVMFSIAAITDALDGFLARRWNMMTAKGAFLDAVADKLIVSSAIVVLMYFDRIDMLVALIIIGREIAVTALREWMAKIGESGRVKVKIRAAKFVKVNAYGKIKTIAQMTAIAFLLYFDPVLGIDIALIGTVLIYIACALTLYSMMVYLTAAWPHIEASDERTVL